MTYRGLMTHQKQILQKRIIKICPKYCNRFEITFVSEKHVVEDNILFTNHLEGK